MKKVACPLFCETTLDSLQADYKNKVIGVDYSDIEDLKEVISNLKDDEKYYLGAIALATADLASKTVAIASQAAAAASSSGTLGFSAGMALDMKGSKSTTETTATKSNASNITAKNITIATDSTKETSTTISGSNVNATDTLNITTRDLVVLASTDTTSSDKRGQATLLSFLSIYL